MGHYCEECGGELGPAGACEDCEYTGNPFSDDYVPKPVEDELNEI